MKSRMEKYYEVPKQQLGSRSTRNENVYQEIQKSDLDDFNVYSNVAVLGDNKDKIEINEVQKIVEQRYAETPKRRSIPIELEEFNDRSMFDETKDYDINSVLSKARSERTVDYRTDRLKKLRDTQFNILSNLELSKVKVDSLDIEEDKKEVVDTINDADEKLMTLIQTITSKEYKEQEEALNEKVEKKEDLALDILSDLKGDDDTKVSLSKEESMDLSFLKDMTLTRKVDVPPIENKENQFYTDANTFTQSDFDDINGLKEDVKKSQLLVKILIGLIIITFVFGLVVLLNTVLGLGWF